MKEIKMYRATSKGLYECKSGTVAEMEAFLAENPDWNYSGYGVGDAMHVSRPCPEAPRKQRGSWLGPICLILYLALMIYFCLTDARGCASFH